VVVAEARSCLFDISGPTLNETANTEPAGGWQNATLHYELSSSTSCPTPRLHM
jgi:tyrosinase